MPLFRPPASLRRQYCASDRRTRHVIWAAVVSLPLAVTIMIGVLGWQMAESHQVARELRSALTARLAVEHAGALVTSAETAQRGYLLTDNED